MLYMEYLIIVNGQNIKKKSISFSILEQPMVQKLQKQVVP